MIPKSPLRFLRWFCREDFLEEIEGDLMEAYQDRKRSSGSRRAHLMLWLDVFKSFNPTNLNLKSHLKGIFKILRLDMLQNYTKILLRNILRSKVYAAISISSLTIGISAALLIFIYIQRELSYDRFYTDADQIYRMAVKRTGANNSRKIGFVPLALPPYMTENFEGVSKTVRVFQYRRAVPVTVTDTDASFNEARFGWADSTFFDVFNLDFVMGNPATALDEPRSVVITESIAKKYFNDDNPMGKTIEFNWDYNSPLIVTGVVKDFPTNSHFKFDLVSSLRTVQEVMWGGRNWMQRWDNFFVNAYAVLKPGTDLDHLSNEITTLINERLDNSELHFEALFQPLTDIHLYSDLDVGEWEAINDPNDLYTFGVIGFIILFLGCFNFTNMITAQAGRRAREIGLRKVFGSNKWQLVQQHYFETFLYALISIIISVPLAMFLAGKLTIMTGQEYPLMMFAEFDVIAALLGIMVMVCVVAGTYPAFFISGFSPVSILHSGQFSFKSNQRIRNTLIITQFVISICLIICTVLVHMQLNFMKNKELGFQEDLIINIPIQNDDAILPKLDVFKDALTAHQSIRSATSASHLFFANYTYVNQFRVRGVENEFRWERYTVDHDFVETFKLEVVAGRSFDKTYASDTTAFILNEKAVLALGLTPEEAIGKHIENESDQKRGVIIGVVKDFHYRSLHDEIQPFVMYINLDRLDYFSIAISPKQVLAGLDAIENTWDEIFPNVPYFSDFQDQNLASYYMNEEHTRDLFSWFTTVAIFLANMGLFGFALYTSESRSKEIGIRKVLGAGSSQITQMLTGEFVKLVLLAYIISIPISYYLINMWLDGFAFRIDQPWWVYILAGIGALVISALTIVHQSLKSAWANPVLSLKSE